MNSPKFISWLENIFSKNSKKSLANNFRIITMQSFPDEYDSFFKTLCSIANHGSSETIFTKLTQARLTLQLEPLDWLKVFIINQEAGKAMPFSVNLQSLSKLTSEDIGEPLTNAMKVSITSKNENDFFDSRALHSFIKDCISVELIAFSGNVSRRHITLDSVIKVLDSVIDATYSYKKESLKQMKKLRKEMSEYMASEASESIDDLVDSINNQKSVFSALEVSAKITITNDLRENLKEILNKSQQLEPPLLEQVNVITQTATSLMDKEWDSLSASEKVTFKLIIEKDLPTLIFNYLILPAKMRESLVEKGTNISVTQMLSQSLVEIQTDLIEMDKTQEKLDQSLHQIKSTSKYLQHRS